MFAMLHGALPPDIGGPARGHPAAGDALADAVDAQFSAGLDLVTDALDGGPDAGAGLLSALEAGDTGADGLVVRRWRAIAVAVDAAAARHGRPAVAAATITGPFTLARRAGSQGRAADLGAALAVELDSLAEAGCTLVIVDEPDAIEVGADR